MANLDNNTSLNITLTEIEKKVLQSESDRNSLEKILPTKGVTVVSGSKMSTLIGNIPSLKVITNIPIYGDKEFLDNASDKYFGTSTAEVPWDTLNAAINVQEGKAKLTFQMYTPDISNASSSGYVRIVVRKPSLIISDQREYPTSSDSSKVKTVSIEVPLANNVEINLYGYWNRSGYRLEVMNCRLTCDWKIV